MTAEKKERAMYYFDDLESAVRDIRDAIDEDDEGALAIAIGMAVNALGEMQ